MTQMTDTIREIEKRLEEAEPGPWKLGGCSGRMITTPSGYYGDGFIADVDTKANADLIAHAPTDIRFLLGEVARLTERNEALVEGILMLQRGEFSEMLTWLKDHGIEREPLITISRQVISALLDSEPKGDK